MHGVRRRNGGTPHLGAGPVLTTPLRAQASGLSVVRCEQYALPRKIAQAVDLIAPTTHFPAARAKAPAHQKASLPPLAVTPKVLRDIYELGNASGAAPNNRVAVTGFLKEFFQKDSLARRPAPNDPNARLRTRCRDHGGRVLSTLRSWSLCLFQI